MRFVTMFSTLRTNSMSLLSSVTNFVREMNTAPSALPPTTSGTTRESLLSRGKRTSS